MKIELLTLNNLNSLSGKWEIPFNKEPFNGSGLFAITGPTGAGKSTIFDAICLALYGRTPRLKNPDDIMTRHKAESFAELTYSVNGNTYRSRWEQRRSRGKSDGKLQSAKMSLVKVEEKNETIIEEKKSAVPVSNAGITGLDYDQFTRSILLAQGNFASFLKAGINERAELLEKMTGSEIYTKISIEAFNRAREEEEKLQRLKEKAGDTVIMEATEREALTSELESLRQKREETEKQRQQLITVKNWLDQEVLFKHRIDNAKYEYDKASARESESSDLKEEYRKKSIVLKSLPLYESWKKLASDINRLERENREVGERKIVEEEKSTTLQQAVEALRHQLDQDRGKAEILTEKVQAMEILETSISSIKKRIDDQKVDLNSRMTKLSRNSEEIKSLRTESESLNKLIHDHQTYLEENKNHEAINESLPLLRDLQSRLLEFKEIKSESLSDFEQQIEDLRKKISLIKKENPGSRKELEDTKELLLKMVPVSRQYQEVDKNKKNNLDNKNNYSKEYASIESDLSALQKEYDKNISLLEKSDLQTLVKEVQNHLHDGDNCPVCSGTYRVDMKKQSEGPLIDRSSIRKQEAIIQEKKARLAALEQLLQGASEEDVKLSGTLNELLQEWDDLKGSHFPELHPLDRNQANSIYSEYESRILHCINWETEMHTLGEELKLLLDNKDSIEKAAVLRRQTEELMRPYTDSENGKSPSLDNLEKYYQKFSQTRAELEKCRGNIKTITDKLEFLCEKEISLNSEVCEIRAGMETSEKEFDELKQKWLALAEGKSKDQIKEEIRQLKDQTEKELEIKRNELSLSRELLSSLNSTLENNRSLLPDIKKNFDDTKNQLDSIAKENLLNAADFDISDLHEKVEKLKNELDQIKEIKIRTEVAYNKAVESHKEHMDTRPEMPQEEDIDIQLESAGSIIEESSRNIGIIEEKIRQDDSVREQLKDLATHIEGQETECLKWSKMRTLIGSADGKIFRRFVQGLTLEKLVSIANNHLVKLNNRYRIIRSAQKELELEIVDSWQADTIRPAATLSGGESFLVSLALSLGLSELVGNKVVIDSLFLDEGFGTLDPDSLETVLAALETLQSSGKLIGIISHVAAIRERIAVQIRVKKLAGGRSIIEIV